MDAEGWTSDGMGAPNSRPSRRRRRSWGEDQQRRITTLDVAIRKGYGIPILRRWSVALVACLATGMRQNVGCEAATVRIGFLVDWGLKSPLYPAAAAAAARGAAKALGKSGILLGGDSVEWVWHDSACDVSRAYEAAAALLDIYGVDVIVGPACCSAAAVATVLAHQRGVPVVSWACSAAYLSDKLLYPSFFRVVGASGDFALALGALFRRHRWRAVSILFANGPARGMVYRTKASEIRRTLESQGVHIGAWEAFDGEQACSLEAGGAGGARWGVGAAEAADDKVVIVLGDCADYRQIMMMAESRGLRDGWAWILLEAARDPACHVSASTCGRDDGLDSLALSSMAGALSLDWSPRPTSRANAAAYADAAAAFERDDFIATFAPPPGGSALPCCPLTAGQSASETSVGWNVDASEFAGGGSTHMTSDHTVQQDRRERGARGDYEAVAETVPDGTLRAATLMYDAAELALRLATAAAAQGGGNGSRRWSPELAEEIEFEGLSGRVKLDRNGDRQEMSMSFWLLEGAHVNGASYTTAVEAARYTPRDGHVQLLHQFSWPRASPEESYSSQGKRRRWARLDNLIRVLDDGERATLPTSLLLLGVVFIVSIVVLRLDSHRRRRLLSVAEAAAAADNAASAAAAAAAAGGGVSRARHAGMSSPDSAALAGKSSPGSRLGRASPRGDPRSLGVGTSAGARDLGVLGGVRRIRESWRRLAPPRGDEANAEDGSNGQSVVSNLDLVAGDTRETAALSGATATATMESLGRKSQAYATFPSPFAIAIGTGGPDTRKYAAAERDACGHQAASGDQLAGAAVAEASAEEADKASRRGSMDESPRVIPPTARQASLASVLQDSADVAGPERPTRPLSDSFALSNITGGNAMAPPPPPQSQLGRGKEGANDAALEDPTRARSYIAPEAAASASHAAAHQQEGVLTGGGTERSAAVLTQATTATDGSSMDKYDLAAFAPLTEERLGIVGDELRQISDRAKRALAEVEIHDEDFSIGAIVGSGSFAEVRKGRLKGFVPGGDGYPKENKSSAVIKLRAGPEGAVACPLIAVKVLRDVRRQTLKRFWFEVLIMKDLDHPNIVRLLGATWRGRRLMMIVEYVARGNLASVLEEGPDLTWKEQKFDMCLDIATGMAYLHHYKYFDELSNSTQNCVIHRDLKPQNLLVTHDYRVKITDFGEATGKGDDAARTQVGTLLYIAPEIVRGDCYDERCDVYSFAVVLLAMLQLREDVIMLFGEEVLRRNKEKAGTRTVFTHMAITNSIVNEDLRPTLPAGVFETLKILIEQCWAPAPALRPTFDEILEFLETIARDEIVNGQNVLQDEQENALDMMYFDEGELPMEGAPSAPSAGRQAEADAASLDDTEAAQSRTEAQPEPLVVHEAYSGWENVPHARNRKRGKDYRPTKGNMGLKILEKQKESAGRSSGQGPDTILEEEEHSSEPEAMTASESVDASWGGDDKDLLGRPATVCREPDWPPREEDQRSLSDTSGDSGSAGGSGGGQWRTQTEAVSSAVESEVAHAGESADTERPSSTEVSFASPGNGLAEEAAVTEAVAF